MGLFTHCSALKMSPPTILVAIPSSSSSTLRMPTSPCNSLVLVGCRVYFVCVCVDLCNVIRFVKTSLLYDFCVSSFLVFIFFLNILYFYSIYFILFFNLFSIFLRNYVIFMTVNNNDMTNSSRRATLILL